MILTGEPSGDFHGAALVQQLKQQSPGIRITGIGGAAMAGQGAELFYPIEKLSAMGIVQVLKQIGSIKQAFSLVKHQLKTDPPDAVVLIDYPGFNLKTAAYIKQHYNIPICYYIAPKVWAWNSRRLTAIGRYTDHVALIFPFEIPIYKSHNIRATYVGNPLMDEYLDIRLPQTTQTQAKGCTTDWKNDGFPVIGLLPGSRSAEIDNLLPVMLEAATLIKQQVPGVRFLVSSGIEQHHKRIEKQIFDGNYPDIRIVHGRPKQIFDNADMLIAASGTVTLEAALCLVPTIIIYKLSGLTYQLARLLVKAPFIGLANLIAGRMVMPELIQDDANANDICNNALSMLDNLDRFRKGLTLVRSRLGSPGAPERTAKIIFNLILKERC